jgi:hypothetical protein
MKNVSEVLGVGLANVLMCRVLPAERQTISRISGSSSRCDYLIISDGFTTVYEARGRNNINNLFSAATSLPVKKAAHVATHKYGILSFLPVDGLAPEIYVFDPPGDADLRPPTTEERYLQLSRHYASVAMLAGLGTLSRALVERRKAIISGGKWLSEPLATRGRNWRVFEIEGRKYAEEEEGVDRFLTERLQKPLRLGGPARETPEREPRSPSPLHIRFGLDLSVAEALIHWDFEQLSKLKIKNELLPEKMSSIGEDGSILRIEQVALEKV